MEIFVQSFFQTCRVLIILFLLNTVINISVLILEAFITTIPSCLERFYVVKSIHILKKQCHLIWNQLRHKRRRRKLFSKIVTTLSHYSNLIKLRIKDSWYSTSSHLSVSSSSSSSMDSFSRIYYHPQQCHPQSRHSNRCHPGRYIPRMIQLTPQELLIRLYATNLIR